MLELKHENYCSKNDFVNFIDRTFKQRRHLNKNRNTDDDYGYNQKVTVENFTKPNNKNGPRESDTHKTN